jgi:hypothetical protein
MTPANNAKTTPNQINYFWWALHHFFTKSTLEHLKQVNESDVYCRTVRLLKTNKIQQKLFHLILKTYKIISEKLQGN